MGQLHKFARVPQVQELDTLVVPSMGASLAGIIDALEFVIEIENKEVFRMSWKEGLSKFARGSFA